MMSFYPIPAGVLKKVDSYRARLVLQEDEDKKKYHLVNWKTCCKPKDLGGLRILNLNIMNKDLLAKWFWNLEMEEGLWQPVLWDKYVTDGCLSRTQHKNGDSQFWTNIIKFKEIFDRFCRKNLGDGKNTRFWERHMGR